MPRLNAFAALLVWALPLGLGLSVCAADAPPGPPAPPAGEKPAAEKPAGPPAIPADGVLLRYKYARGMTLKLTGNIKITQTYGQSDIDKPVDREAAIDVDGELTFVQITADGGQAVAEARVKSTTAGESTFTKTMTRIDDRGQVLSDQSNLPAPRPDAGDPAVVPPGKNPAASGAAAPAVPPADSAPAVPPKDPTAAKDPAPPATPADGAAAPANAGRPNRGGPGGPGGGSGGRGAEAKAPDAAPLQFSRMIFPVGKVKVGDSWTNESFHVQTGAAGAPKMKDTLVVTVKEIKPQGDHNIVTLSYKLTSVPVETIANLTGASTVAQGESDFDLEAGAIVKVSLKSDTTAEAVTDSVKSSLKIHAEANYKVAIDNGQGVGGPSGGPANPRGRRGNRGPGGPGGPGGGAPPAGVVPPAGQ